MIKVFILNGPHQGKSFKLEGDTTCIGRSLNNDIQIKDSSISRNHLKILREKKRYFVEDLRTTNGSFINGKRLEPGKKFEVKEGLPIVIGRVLISLGKASSEDSTNIQNLADLSGELSTTGIFTLDRRRPYTTTKNLELIYKVSNVLVQSLDIDEILQKILDYIFDLLKRIDRGAILLINSDTGKLEQIIGRSKFDKEKTNISYSRTIAEKVMKEGKPFNMPDLSREDTENFSDSMRRMKSVMCVPLISRSQVRGVIYVDSVDKPFGFREEDLSLITSLSSPAAVAIENALFYSNLEKTVEDRTRSLIETEEKLRESETRFKAIYDNMSSGVMVSVPISDGEDFVIFDLNKAAQQIEKIKKREVLGKLLLEAFPKFKEIDLVEIFQRVWKTGKPETHLFALSQDGAVTGWRECYIYRLHSGEIVAIYDDVTGKKKAEAEQKVLQEQLLVSQKMESIGTFAGGTAHNFRNILQAISGNIEYLEMVYGEKTEIRDTAKSIHDSVEKGVDLINSLLHFSKKGGELQLIDVDLSEVITKTYGIIEKVFDKNIEIKLDLRENLFIKGNHSLLSQVFLNLFTNARDAMPDGGKLLVEARKRNNKVVVIVSDSGHGMDKETMDQIFDPFFTLKDVGKGTGLGLSTTHGIVEQHKGSIYVSSKQGKGAKFTIHLPFEKPESSQRPEPQKKIIMGKGQKVLIIDDDPPALEALTNLTKGLGYKAMPVNRPVEALDNYTKWSPDIVLMDRNMPEMDGLSCIKQIMETDPNARIIIVSGYEDSGQDGIDDNIRSLIKGYLTKPCGTEELSRMLSQALG
jgi:signal transduction histidine kinase/pSer/pThr/pTyr-binding forkhead associated (FHA) protein